MFYVNEIFIQIGVKIFIDSKALMVLVGTEMDYIEDEIISEFVFNNPNEKVYFIINYTSNIFLSG